MADTIWDEKEVEDSARILERAIDERRAEATKLAEDARGTQSPFCEAMADAMKLAECVRDGLRLAWVPVAEYTMEQIEGVKTKTCRRQLVEGFWKWVPVDTEVLDPSTNPKDAVGVNKTMFSAIPGAVLTALAAAMFEGVVKYGRHNYRVIGVRNSVYYDAAMRHLQAWWEGEDVDADSGLPHTWKALACLAVIIDAQECGKVTDDRPPPSPVPDMMRRVERIMSEVRERHADRPEPHHYTKMDTPTGS